MSFNLFATVGMGPLYKRVPGVTRIVNVPKHSAQKAGPVLVPKASVLLPADHPLSSQIVCFLGPFDRTGGPSPPAALTVCVDFSRCNICHI